jgi:hypothetical protein
LKPLSWATALLSDADQAYKYVPFLQFTKLLICVVKAKTAWKNSFWNRFPFKIGNFFVRKQTPHPEA